jgi:hypothetical protein
MLKIERQPYLLHQVNLHTKSLPATFLLDNISVVPEYLVPGNVQANCNSYKWAEIDL